MRIARIEGAIALVPGYINYLWQGVRMTLRLAAIYGHDPAALRFTAPGVLIAISVVLALSVYGRR